MKINNTTGSDIIVAGFTIPANGTYKVDPNNDDLRPVGTSEMLRALVCSGALTLTFGDVYTPTDGEIAIKWIDRIANGILEAMPEA